MIQNLLIAYLLNPMSRLMAKVSQKGRDTLFLLGGIGVVVHFFIHNMELDSYRFLIFFAINCIFMGMMLLGSLGGEIKPVKFNKFMAFCWFGVAALTILSGFTQSSSYLPDGVLMLVILPVLFICWCNMDRQHVFKLLLKICRISLIIFLVVSFLLIEITTERYPGLFANTNNAAYYLAVVSVALIVDVLYEKNKLWLALDILLLGIATAMDYYTNSRSGPLAVICAGALGGFIYLLTHGWRDNLRALIRMGAVAVAASVCISGLVYVFQLRSYLPLPYYEVTTQEFYMDPFWEEFYQSLTDPTDPTDDPSDPSDKKPNKKPNKDFFNNEGFKDVNDKKNEIGDKTADKFSTGRISVWKAYAKDLNLFGHESTPKVYIDMLYREIASTHMTILQVGYESGLPAGILYLLLNLGSGIYTIYFAWKNREEKYALMPLMITVAFGALSMLGSCRVAFWYWTTFMYYLVLFPIMAAVPEKPALSDGEENGRN